MEPRGDNVTMRNNGVYVSETEIDQSKTVIDSFEEQAKHHPDWVAVRYKNEEMTYEELNHQSNQVAHLLKDQGLNVEEPVAVCMDKSIHMIVAILGILKAGGYYVPLDPTLPSDRLTKIIKRINSPILLTDSANESFFHSDHVRSMHHIERSTLVKYATTNLSDRASIHHLIYTIFTSGTTGEPKGVQVEHRNVLNHLQGILGYMNVVKPLNYTLLTTIAADLSVTPIFAALITGGTLHIIPEEMITDAEKLGIYCREYGVNCMKLVPSHMEALLYRDTPSIYIPDYIILGGEQLKWSLVDKIKERHLTCKIFNHYGPTEVTVGVMANDIDQVERTGSVIPLGEPYGCSVIMVLDENLDPVVPGEIGEIYISGLGITRGYFQNDFLTKEKYMPNPWQEGEHDHTLYKTGDLARVNPQGQLEFVSRIDHQVKVRGYRVELNEIQAHLEAKDEIQDSAVVARINQNGETIIRAALVFDPAYKGTVKQIREALVSTLPAYMLPQEYVVLDSLPLNANGKVNRQLITNQVLGELAGAHEEEMSVTEKKIHTIWSSLLDSSHMNRTDRFLEVGGNSLNAIKLASELEDAFQVRVTIGDVFEQETIEDLASLVEGRQEQTEGSQLERSHFSTLEASSQQSRLWFWGKLDVNRHLYNIPYKVKLTGGIDPSRLHKAIRMMMVKHEILRTRIIENDGRPMQKVDVEGGDVPFEVVNASMNPHDVEEFIEDKAKRAFDISKGTLFEVVLYKVSPEDHTLFLNFHHSIFDDWSFTIFLEDLLFFYYSPERGLDSSQLLQYQDYSEWHKKHLLIHRENLVDYWSRVLEGNVEKVKFADYHEAANESFEGESFHFHIPGKSVEKVNRLAKETGTTKFMVLMSLFQLMLYKYTHKQDIIVGAPVAGRPGGHFDQTLGFFVNTLPWRTQFDETSTFMSLLRHVQKQSVDHLKHVHLPFEDIVKEVRSGVEYSLTPIMNIMMAFQNAPKLNRDKYPLLTGAPEKVNNHTSKYDLTLFLEENEGEILGRWEYKSFLFTEGRIKQFTRHFSKLLDGLYEKPLNSRIEEFNLLTKEEEKQLTETIDEVAPSVGLHALFEAQAKRTPENLAVIQGDNQLTYKELDERSSYLRDHLIQRGVSRNDIVAISMDRSPEMLVSLLGILKAGGAYLPIDAGMPPGRVEEILTDSRAKVIVVCGDQSHSTEFSSIMDVSRLDWDQADGCGNSIVVEGTDVVSVYYTSGSTGKPKGVANHHQGWVNRMEWMQSYHQLREEETVLHKTTLSFDDAAVEIFWPLIIGARVALMNPEEHKDPRAIIEDTVKYDASILHFVPSMLKLFVEEISEEEEKDMPSLRAIISSGEALATSLVKDLFSKLDVRLLNSWGATEVSIDSTCYECTLSDVGGDRFVPVGKPIQGNYIYVLDKSMKPVPPGVIGDLYIGGVGLAKGYVNDPEKTRNSFIQNPYHPDEKIYRTGDQGYLRLDGNLVFTGRKDSQVKVRGMRVELGEIESSIKAFSAIKDAIVHFADPSTKQGLVGYMVVKEPFEQNHLHQFMSRKLPDYMMPKYMVELAAFPINKNGKLDYHALPKPSKNDIFNQEEYLPPETPMEVQLSRIWEELLETEEISVESNFFTVGGHSLLGVKLISRVNRSCDTDLRLRDLFDSPTIREMAVKAERISGGLQETNNGGNPFHPLSYAQERMWFLHQLDPADYSYHMPYGVKMSGELDLDIFRDSIKYVLKQNTILHSRFRLEKGNPYAIAGDIDVQIELETAGGTDHLINEWLRQPFNLEEDAPYRMKLVKVKQSEFHFYIVFHHIVMDGISLEFFEQQLFETYNRLKEKKPLAIRHVPSYYEYAKGQKEYSTSTFYKDQLEYWKGKLSGELVKTQFPLDQHNHDLEEQTQQMTQTFSESSFRNIKKISRRHGSSNFTIVASVLSILLHRINGQEDLIMGTPIIDRPSKWEESMGLFLNTLPLRIRVQSEQTIDEVIRETSQSVRELFMHQDVPFEKIVEEVQPNRTGNSNPLFDILVNYISYEQNQERLNDLEVERKKFNDSKAKFLLTFYFIDEQDSLSVRVVFQGQKIHETRIQTFLHQFNTVCESLLANQDTSVGRLDINHTHTNAAVEPSLQKVPFAKTLKKAIEDNLRADALEEQRTIWTYKDVMEYANGYTHAFRNLNLSKGDRIALFGKSSFRYIASIVSMMVNGYVFVPIHVDTPKNRIKRILEEAEVSLFVDFDQVLSATERDDLNVLYFSPTISIPGPDHLTEGLLGDSTVDHNSDAYIYFTSGSTGTPKGIMGNQKGLNHFLCWQRREFDIQPSDRIAQLTNPGFDVYLRDVFLSLISGATLCIPDGNEEEIDWMKRKEITVVHAVPSLVKRWMEHTSTKGLLIRLTFFAGEPLPYDLVTEWKEIIGAGADVVNLYGPSETTLAKSFHRVGPNEERLSIVPIGQAIPETEVLILNTQQSLSGVNEPGEIVIKTPYRTSGYLNRNDTFSQNPLSTDKEDLVYFTGDIGRYHPNGFVEILGRKDFQVKLNGVRIDLNEVEYFLNLVPVIKQAIVTKVEEGKREYLVAYMVPEEGAEISEYEVRKHLLENLPISMIPLMVKMENLPINQNGKVDRKKLPHPKWADGAHDQLVGPEEEKLAGIWKQILHIETSLRKNDDFFALGGHSLLAIRLLNEILDQFHTEVKLIDLFENPTIKRMNQLIGSRMGNADANAKNKISKAARVPIKH